MSEDELIGIAGAAPARLKVRSGDIAVKPGFDGEFGKIRVLGESKRSSPPALSRPGSLIA